MSVQRSIMVSYEILTILFSDMESFRLFTIGHIMPVIFPCYGRYLSIVWWGQLRYLLVLLVSKLTPKFVFVC